VVGILALALSSPVLAATLHCPSGDVPCFIAAIRTANETPTEDTIILDEGIYNLTAVDNTTDDFIGNGLPSVTGVLTIRGAGATTTIIQRDPALGDPFTDPFVVPVPFRILHVSQGGHLTLEGVTIQGGAALSGAGVFNVGTLSIAASIIRRNMALRGIGGGILNVGALAIVDSWVVENAVFENSGGGIVSGGTLTISRSTVSLNGADGFGGLLVGGTAVIADSEISDNGGLFSGGGIGTQGDTTITNTTIARNRASLERGGGVYVLGGVLRLTNVTVADNLVDSLVGSAGGLLVEAGSVQLQNTILARNFSRPPEAEQGAGSGPDCWGSLTSLGNNVLGDTTDCAADLLSTDQIGDPGLGTFVEGTSSGGGHIPLLAGSVAVDAGNPAACLPTDQLGRLRADGDGNGTVVCDIGAIELVVDADSDGVADASDDCPDSNLAATVVLGGHDTGVPNRVLPSGCTVNDRLSACALATTDSRPRRGLVGCLAHLALDLKESGLITDLEARNVQGLARQVGIPSPVERR
jgi:hypothetical protein